MRIKTIQRLRQMAAIRADRWRAFGRDVRCEGRLVLKVEREEDARYVAAIHNAVLPLVNQLVLWYNKLRDQEALNATPIDFAEGDDPFDDRDEGLHVPSHPGTTASKGSPVRHGKSREIPRPSARRTP